MTNYSGISKAVTEFDFHTHTFPDGSISTAHSHTNGDTAHQHMIKLDAGFWMIDYGKDPMLRTGVMTQPVQAQNFPIAQPGQLPTHVHSFNDPAQGLTSGAMAPPKVAVNQTNPSWPVGFKVHFEAGSLLPPGFVWEDDLVYGSPAPEPKKSRADLIWEAIQGASKA